MAIRALTPLFGGARIAALVVPVVAGAVAAMLLWRSTSEEFGVPAERHAVALFALTPYRFFTDPGARGCTRPASWGSRLHRGASRCTCGFRELIAAAINAAEQRARHAVPGLRLVMYLEPDIDRGASDPVSWLD